MDTEQLLAKAKESSFWLWVMNRALLFAIPFNKPHGLKVQEVSDEKVKVSLPYKRKNLNHLKGLHACALATAGEYASGLLLLSQLGMKKYRLIMESIEVKYHYQGKKTAYAVYELTKERLKREVVDQLIDSEKVYFKCEIPLYDEDQNHICTVYTNWQIKSWDKVKLKVK